MTISKYGRQYKPEMYFTGNDLIIAQSIYDGETGLKIYVSHFPPGTSKWNKIEHRLFSYISINWRGKPLESLLVILGLIGATTTETGLTVKAVLDEKQYETGIKISD